MAELRARRAVVVRLVVLRHSEKVDKPAATRPLPLDAQVAASEQRMWDCAVTLHTPRGAASFVQSAVNGLDLRSFRFAHIETSPFLRYV